MTERIYTIGVYIRARQPRCWASVALAPRSDLRKPAWLAKGAAPPVSNTRRPVDLAAGREPMILVGDRWREPCTGRPISDATACS